MRSLLFAILAAFTLGSCVDVPAEADRPVPIADTNWIGEMRLTDGDTVIRLCGSGKIYRLTGPDLDTMAYRYHYASMNVGQWMKVWCYGHLGTASRGELVDSALIAVKFQHLDASLHCDPVPDARVSGDWKLQDVDLQHPRDIRIELFTDGSATMFTDLYTGLGVFEEEGTWGVDAENQVNVHWPMRDQTMRFTWEGEVLNSARNSAGKGISMRRQGPADRLAGSFGRAARWIASTATDQGRPTRAEDLLPLTPIAEVFPAPEALQAFRAQVNDSLKNPTDALKAQAEAATTVRDIARLIRIGQR